MIDVWQAGFSLKRLGQRRQKSGSVLVVPLVSRPMSWHPQCDTGHATHLTCHKQQRNSTQNTSGSNTPRRGYAGSKSNSQPIGPMRHAVVRPRLLQGGADNLWAISQIRIHCRYADIFLRACPNAKNRAWKTWRLEIGVQHSFDVPQAFGCVIGSDISDIHSYPGRSPQSTV